MALIDWLGDISHLEPYSPIICSDHADELRQHFRIGGIESFGRSTVDAMLQRAELYASNTKPCVKCGGHIWSGPEDPECERGGCGFVPSHSKRNRAVSQKQADFLAVLGIDMASVPVSADLPCPACGCHGWVATGKHAVGPLTARPTGSSIKGEPSASNLDTNLQILAVCGRRLDRADCLLPIASTGLAAYLEPGGGILMALWHLVPSGKTWLRQNTRDMPTREFFSARRASQEKNHDPKVEVVMGACDAQAEDLLDAVGRAWNAAIALEQAEAAA